MIALDYDGTYTLNPWAWQRCVEIWRSVGLSVICVTCRSPTPENLEEVVCPGVPRYFTSGSPKRWYLEQQGIKVKVWIDDNPESIVRGM